MAKITSSIPIKFNGIKRHNDLEGLNDGNYIHLTELEKQKFDTLPNSFAPVAISNDYNDLDNLPIIPLPLTNHSELNLDDGTNPHNTTKNDVGLGNVPNLDTTNAVNKAHEHTNFLILNGTEESFTTALKNAYNSAVSWIITNGVNLINHLTNTSNPHNVTKSQVGLGNVDNTSDVNKPISTATQNALNLKANAKWLGIDDVNSGAGVTGVTIETLDKTYHLPPNTLVDGHLDFSMYSIRETGSSLLHQVVVRVNNVNNFATATELFRNSTGGNFSPHLRAQRKFTLKNNLIRDAALVSGIDIGSAATGISVPFNLSGNIYIFFSTIPGATNQIIKFDSIQIKQF